MVGEKIKQARTSQNQTQAELAALVGVSANLVSKWENGERTPQQKELVKVAEILNIDISLLNPENSPLLSLPVLVAVKDGRPVYQHDPWTDNILYEKIPESVLINDIFDDQPSQYSRSELNDNYCVYREKDGTTHIIRPNFNRIIDRQYYAMIIDRDIAIRQLFTDLDDGFFSVHVNRDNIDHLVLSIGRENGNSRFKTEELVERTIYTPKDRKLIIGIVVTSIRKISRKGL